MRMAVTTVLEYYRPLLDSAAHNTKEEEP